MVLLTVSILNFFKLNLNILINFYILFYQHLDHLEPHHYSNFHHLNLHHLNLHHLNLHHSNLNHSNLHRTEKVPIQQTMQLVKSLITDYELNKDSLINYQVQLQLYPDENHDLINCRHHLYLLIESVFDNIFNPKT